MTRPRSRIDALIPPEREFLLPQEVAQLFGVDRRTVGRWIAAGRLAGIKTPGGRWRLDAQPVRDFLSSQLPPADWS